MDVNNMLTIAGEKLLEILDSCFGEDVEIDEPGVLIPDKEFGHRILHCELKIKVNGIEPLIDLFVKVIHVEMPQEVYDHQIMAKKEYDAYTRAIPALIRFQKDWCVVKHKIIFDIFPTFCGGKLHSNDDIIDGVSVLVFDNLKTQNYRSCDRLVGFSFKEAKVIVKTLARMHAVSIAIRKKRPDVFYEEVMPCLAENYTIDLSKDRQDEFILTTMKVVRCFREFRKGFKIQQMAVEVFKNTGKPRPPPNEVWGAIVHNDLWAKRLLWSKCKCGDHGQVRIVDLHLMVHDSAVRDLILFLFTSLEIEVFKSHLDELIGHYHAFFVYYLQDYYFNLEPYSKNNFLQEIENVAPTELVRIAFMLNTIYDTEENNTNDVNVISRMMEVVSVYIKRKWI